MKENKETVSAYYKLADGKKIKVNVSQEVMEVLRETGKKALALLNQDDRHIVATEFDEDIAIKRLDSNQDDMTEAVHANQQSQMLKDALNILTEKQKRRVIAYYINGLTYRKIAENEGVAHKQIIKSVKLAIKKLKKFFQEGYQNGF